MIVLEKNLMVRPQAKSPTMKKHNNFYNPELSFRKSPKGADFAIYL